MKRMRISAQQKLRKRCAICWRKWCQRELVKMPKLRAFPSVERQQLHRHFQEATINTFHRFSDLRPLTIRQVLVLVVINNPQGIYYGGTIAAPVAKEIFENILPYLDK